MIDITIEKPIRLSAAVDYFPRTKSGKLLHPSTAYRYATRGIRGVKMEVVKIGGCTCTTREAIMRFIIAQQILEQPTIETVSPRKQRSVRQIRAADELATTLHSMNRADKKQSY
ncbi:DUF1580 domain-containing protein [Lacunimicrobium album]